MFFASDNTSGAAPEVLAALSAANEGFERSYGADALMARVERLVRDAFEAPEAAVYLVATGTAANALSIACLTPPWGAVYCHADSHIAEDECGAPEFYTAGAKLVGLPGAHGRIDTGALAAAIGRTGAGGVHGVQRGMLSLTNATEAGATYTPAAVRALASLAKSHGIPVHMDGARFANAVARLGCSPADLTWRAGVDALSFGGTKNGCLGVEAVVLFDPARAWEFELRRKRAGHLFSKHRFLSAQMAAYLEDGLWLRLASQANGMADRLAAGIAALPGADILHPVEANMIFAALPRAVHARAFGAGARYYLVPPSQAPEGPPGEALSARFVCSWNTGESHVEALLAALRGGA